MTLFYNEVIERHTRSYGREEMIFDPLHYLALLEQKTNALDQAAPLLGWLLPEEFAELRRQMEALLGTPADKERVAEYEAGPYKGYGKKIQEAFAAIVPPDPDAGAVAEAIVKVVDLPFGKRPFRVHIDPTQDGADVAFAVLIGCGRRCCIAWDSTNC